MAGWGIPAPGRVPSGWLGATAQIPPCQGEEIPPSHDGTHLRAQEVHCLERILGNHKCRDTLIDHVVRDQRGIWSQSLLDRLASSWLSLSPEMRLQGLQAESHQVRSVYSCRLAARLELKHIRAQVRQATRTHRQAISPAPFRGLRSPCEVPVPVVGGWHRCRPSKRWFGLVPRWSRKDLERLRSLSSKGLSVAISIREW